MEEPESRFAQFEQGHILLQKDVSELAKDVSALTQAVHGITTSVRTLSERQVASVQTNWGVIFSGIGIAVLVAGLVFYQPLNLLSALHREHTKDGHPKSVLDKIHADESSFRNRLDRKQSQLEKIESRLDSMAANSEKVKEQVLNIERTLYPGARYRKGRPVSGIKAEKN